MRKREIQQIMTEIATVRKYSDEYLNQQIKNIYRENINLEGKLFSGSFISALLMASALMLVLVSGVASVILATVSLFPISGIICNGYKLHKNKKFLDSLNTEQKRRYEQVRQPAMKNEHKAEQTQHFIIETTTSKQEDKQEIKDNDVLGL